MTIKILSMIDTKIYRLHPDGNKFVIFAGICTLITMFHFTIVSQIFFLLMLFFLLFFRNPHRETPLIQGAIFSPGDGIVKIVQETKIPTEIKEFVDTSISWSKISIFLSVFDVHVNRIPISGKISHTFYKKGMFKNAMNNESSEKNESQYIVIENSDHQVVCQQIAGLIARRIVCNAKQNDKVKSGDEYGIIRFGSRMDVYFPTNIYIPMVKPGDFVKTGESVIATASK